MVFLSRVVYQAVLRRIEPARLATRQVVILHCFAKRQACQQALSSGNFVVQGTDGRCP
jgi:phage-related protein